MKSNDFWGIAYRPQEWSYKEYTFVCLKKRFGCFRRNMNINLMSHVILSSFILHNFCELKNETVIAQLVKAASKYDQEFQSAFATASFTVSNNDTGGKLTRSTLVKYFA